MTDDARRVPLLMGLLFGLTGLGSAASAVVLPQLGQDLGIDVGPVSWTISLYALMLAVATPVYGRVSDLVGVRLSLLVYLMSLGALLATTCIGHVTGVGHNFSGAGRTQFRCGGLEPLGVSALIVNP